MIAGRAAGAAAPQMLLRRHVRRRRRFLQVNKLDCPIDTPSSLFSIASSLNSLKRGEGLSALGVGLALFKLGIDCRTRLLSPAFEPIHRHTELQRQQLGGFAAVSRNTTFRLRATVQRRRGAEPLTDGTSTWAADTMDALGPISLPRAYQPLNPLPIPCR